MEGATQEQEGPDTDGPLGLSSIEVLLTDTHLTGFGTVRQAGYEEQRTQELAQEDQPPWISFLLFS